jgi:hypothetical protein
MAAGGGSTPAKYGGSAYIAPLVFSWIANNYKEKIECRFIRDIPLMHSCTETNTYVLGPDVIRHNEDLDDDALDLLIDMGNLDKSPLPFGQITFFSYYEAGEFILEGATEKWNAHRAVLAFESFGYKDASMLANYMRVSEADKFKLMLKYGY